MKIINLYICLMMLATTLGYAQFNEYEGDSGGGYGTPQQLHEVVITTQSNSYTTSYSSYIPTFVGSYYSNSVPNGFDTTANSYSYGDYGGGPSTSQGTTYTVQPTTPTTPTAPPTQNLIDKPVLTLDELLALIKDLKTGTWNIVKTTVYAYVDSAGVTHIGYLTSITDSSNTSHSLYYFNELGGNDNQVKLPEKNGVEISSSINSHNNTYETPIVVVTTWDGTANQPGIGNPDSVWAIDNNTGNWLIVTSQQAYTDYQNKQTYAAMVTSLKNYLGLNQEQVSWLSADNDRIIQLNNFYNTPYNTLEDTKEYLDEYMNSEIITDTNLQTNPFVEGKNYVFDSTGKPKEAGAAGDLIQIEINGVKKLPSELDVTDYNQMRALTKIAIFLAAKAGAPQGSRFGTGTWSTYVASVNPAFTSPYAPYFTIFNHHGGYLNINLNNIYSFTNIIQHELAHQKNFKSTSPHIDDNISTHIDVYIDAIEKTSFLKSPAEYRLSTVRSLATYIWNMDKKPGKDNAPYTFEQIKDKIDRFNQRSNFNGGYRLVAPTVNGNIAFPKGSLGNANYPFKIYDPASNQEIAVDFTPNIEN